MEEDTDMKWVILYTWFLTVAGGLYFGHEIGYGNARKDLAWKLDNCHKIIRCNGESDCE